MQTLLFVLTNFEQTLSFVCYVLLAGFNLKEEINILELKQK